MFQVDVEARTSNTAVLFAGVYLTVGSLRDPFRESISTSSIISKLRSHSNHPMTSVPIARLEHLRGGAGRRSGWKSKAVFAGFSITGSTSLKRIGRAIAHPASRCAPSRIYLHDIFM